MATTPKIRLFSSEEYVTNLNITTNIGSLTVRGIVDLSSVDIQVSINGDAFYSDPSLVSLSKGSFVFPNLSSYPNGFELSPGVNTVLFRSVSLDGSVSVPSTLTIDLVKDTTLGEILSPPTGISLKRKANSVEVVWTDVQTSTATGYNIYASTGSSGTGSGYLKVNADVIPASGSFESIEVTEVLDSNTFSLQGLSSQDFEVSTRTIDAVTNTVASLKTLNRVPLILSPSFSFEYSVKGVSTYKKFSFEHNRVDSVGSGVLNNDVFSAVRDSDPLFYVITAVYFDPDLNIIKESRYSSELSGAQLPLDGTIRGIRIRDQSTISQSYLKEVEAAEPTISLIPGSTIQEVHILPFSNEMQKVYFLADFVHRSKSFAALLSIDDPNLSGTSVPVANSAYKQQLKSALSVSEDSAVQALIDNSFDVLASNDATPRLGSRPSVVTQTFYTEKKPTKDLIVSSGAIVSSSSDSNAPRFLAKSQSTISFLDSQRFYNNETKRYEIEVEMVADSPGSDGNLSSGVLDTINSGAPGLKTINNFRSKNGFDRESNLSLAERCMLNKTSVDTGTEGGILSIAKRTPGVLDTKIVGPGDPFMVRDYNPTLGIHLGGKVDVYIKGSRERVVTETFGFKFNVARGMRLEIVDVSSLIFRALDSRLTVDNPIQELIDSKATGYGVYNVSNGSYYDLSSVTFLDFRTFRLGPQSFSTNSEDNVTADYRYRSNNRIVPSVQPVLRVTSVIGEKSGSIDSVLGYTLNRSEDPLYLGNSTEASDFIQINQVGGIPSGISIPVSNEPHVLIGSFEESLNSVSVNHFSVRVYSSDRSVLYFGPEDVNPDYFLVESDGKTSVIRSNSSNIPSGASVVVDYEHDENFVIQYVVNDVLNDLLNRINSSKHINSHIVVKQSVENPVSIEEVIQLKKNYSKSVVDKQVRDLTSVLFDSSRTGETIHVSDVIGAQESADGLDFIVQPFTKFTLSDGALRVRDILLSDSTYIPGLSSGANAVFMLDQPLPFSTVDFGGPITSHRGVFVDNVPFDLTPLSSLSTKSGQAFISGSLGAIVPGITSVTDSGSVLKSLTGNRVFISLYYDGSVPLSELTRGKSFSVSYTVSGDTGVKDIPTSGIEFLTLGDLTSTYRTP